MSWKSMSFSVGKLFLLGGMLTLTGCGFSQVVKVDEIIKSSEIVNAVKIETEESTSETTENSVGIEENKMEREAVKEIGFLKTKGKNIVTNYGKGDLINLRGVNVGGYLLQEFWMTPTKPSANVSAEKDIYDYLGKTYGEKTMASLINVYQSNYFTEEDMDRCASLGINVLRLPFWYLNIVNEDGMIKEDWYEVFDWFIEAAGKRGMYVILDFHGAPGSQSGSDHTGIDGGEEKEEASEFFFGDEVMVEKNQELFYEIWEMMAIRYVGNPVVAGYDLLNEPYCTYRYSSKLNASELHQKLWAVYDEAYQRIRAIDPDHIIMMEATWDPIDLPNPDEYGWTNVVYEYHNYLYDDYDNAKGQQIGNMKKKLNLIKSANYDVPTLMGEFNYFNNFEAWDEGLKLLNSEGVNWTMWTYKVTYNYGNWGLYHHTSGDINIETVDDEKLSMIWAKVGDVRPNQRLIDVVKVYLNQEWKAYE